MSYNCHDVASAIQLLSMGMPQLSAKLMQRKELHHLHFSTNIVRLIKEEQTDRSRGMYKSFSGKTRRK